MAVLTRWIATTVVTAAHLPGVGRGEVAGKWVAELTSATLLEPAYIRVVLERTGDAVSGAWGTEIVKGTGKGSTVSLALTDTAGRDGGHGTQGGPRRGWCWRTRSRAARRDMDADPRTYAASQTARD